MTGRMVETAKYYLEGDTKGNMTQSMLKGGYKPGYALTNCEKVKRNKEFIKALEQRRAIIDKVEGITIEIVRDRFIDLMDRCKIANDRVNEARCAENLGKHVGLYGEDNKQKAEQRQLSEKEAEEARRIASIRLQMPA